MASRVPDESFDTPLSSTTATTSIFSDHDDSCPFCRISALYPPYNPHSPPPATSPALSPALTSPNPEAYVLLSTPLAIAFLDIMPLARGHLLLCPRRHAPTLAATTAREARALGHWLRVLSAALRRATGVGDWNVVQNNGAAAAQVVLHVHYHVIPRPEIRAQGRWRERFTMFGRGQRSGLDAEDGEALAARVRAEVARALREEAGGGDGGGGASTKGRL